MRKPKISYSLTRHASQSRAAAAYQAILAERYEIVGNQDQADIVIVHHPPRNYETVYALHPALKDKYVISCCVAHASDLPATWRRNLERVQEVWTCSRFCRDVFARYHPRVTLVPYAVERDFACSADALACVKRLIDFKDDRVYFLAIAPADEARKNIPCLVESFVEVADAMPNARLVVKGTHLNSPAWAPHSQVLFLPLMMPFEYINALINSHMSTSVRTTRSPGGLRSPMPCSTASRPSQRATRAIWTTCPTPTRFPCALLRAPYRPTQPDSESSAA